MKNQFRDNNFFNPKNRKEEGLPNLKHTYGGEPQGEEGNPNQYIKSASDKPKAYLDRRSGDVINSNPVGDEESSSSYIAGL